MASRTVSRDDTTYFNPGVGDQAPDFTRESRGVDPLQGRRYAEGYGDKYQGLGNIWEMIVNGSDAVIKQDIKSTVYEKGDDIMDRELGYKAPPPGVKESGAPMDLVRRGERLKNLQSARQAGRLTDSHYYALLDVESRKLRDRYPGHRDYIDSTMESITGYSAQKYRAELAQEAASAGASISKDEQYIRQNEEFLSKSSLERWQNGQLPFNEAQLEVAKKKRLKSDIEIENAQYSLDKNDKEADIDKKLGTLRKEANYTFALTSDGGQSFTQLNNQLEAAMRRGQNLGPQEAAEMAVRVSSYTQEMRTKLNAVSLGRFYSLTIVLWIRWTRA
jgi:hypothetical protein